MSTRDVIKNRFELERLRVGQPVPENQPQQTGPPMLLALGGLAGFLRVSERDALEYLAYHFYSVRESILDIARKARPVERLALAECLVVCEHVLAQAGIVTDANKGDGFTPAQQIACGIES